MRLPAYQRLSKEQDKVVNLPLDGSYLVFGPPGSGKTVVALYRAQMLREQKRKAHLLMYSRLLSQYTRSASSHLEIDSVVTTYDRWLTDFFWSSYRRAVPSTGPWEYDWNEIFDIVNNSPPPPKLMPDLVVDEGQDLPKQFYIAAQMVSSNLTVFADENQRLSPRNSTLTEIRDYGGFTAQTLFGLTRNYRNTREIAALAATFYTGLQSGVTDPPEREGEVPVAIRHRSLSDTVSMIRNFEGASPDLQIGVFTPSKYLQKQVLDGLQGTTIRSPQSYARVKGERPPEVDFSLPGIYVVNYPSAKGLEFDAVFLPALEKVRVGDDPTTAWMTMYVLTSRARERLYLCYSGAKVPPILDGVPADLLEWRT